MTDDKVKARHDCEAANHGFDGSGCVFGYMQAKLDIAQAEMDKLSAEVERQRHENDRLHEVIAGIISTDAGNRADLEASEAKLAALVGHVQELVDFCDDPHGSEKAETLGLGLARLLPPIRQALAHHSAPVGEDAGDETAHLLSSSKNAARLAEATTPTSAPVEDVGGLEPGDLEWLRSQKVQDVTHPKHWPYWNAVNARIDRILDALSPSLIQPQGEERSEDLGLAAADDNHKALVEAVARHVFMGALKYAFGYDAKTTDRLTLEQREATIQRLSAEALDAFQSRQEGK